MESHPETGGEERRTGAGHKTLQCVVVTPEKTLLDETVDFVSLPLFDGELGVLPGRSPLIGRLGYGELRTRLGETVHRYYVDGGFAQIRDNVVTVLTNRALAAAAIDPAAASSRARASPGQARSVRPRFRRENQGRGPHPGHDPGRQAQGQAQNSEQSFQWRFPAE